MMQKQRVPKRERWKMFESAGFKKFKVIIIRKTDLGSKTSF